MSDAISWPWCCTDTVLTPAEFVALAKLPNGHNELIAEVECELESGHAGAHMALGQAYGSRSRQEAWLIWDENGRQLRDLPPCPILHQMSGKVCLLPFRHAGQHNFTLE